MFKIIFEKELKEILSSSKFIITFGVCSLLIILSFFTGAEGYKMWESRYNSQVSENLRQMSGLTDWRRINHNVYLPPQPLAALVNGVSNDIGQTMAIRGTGELKAVDSQFQENPLFAVFKFLDLEFIFQIILSLFAILFAYNAINGEKEMGTLKLSFANSLPKDSYILGKLAGYLTAIVIPLLVPVIIGFLILFIMGIPLTSSEWIRLILIIGGGILYFGVFLTLSIFVSSLTQKSSSSFLILLVIWIFSVLILPRTSVLLAGNIVDVPSVDEIAAKKFRNQSQLWSEDMKKLNTFKPKSEDPQQALKEFQENMQKISSERNAKIMEFNSKLNEVRSNKQAEQEKLAFVFSRISPASSFSLAMMALAGSSLRLQDEYLKNAQNYQETFRQFMKEKTGSDNAMGGMFILRIGNNEEKPKPIDPNEIPKFDYKKPELAGIMQDATLDFGLLFLFNLIFFAGSYLAFMKYDVR